MATVCRSALWRSNYACRKLRTSRAGQIEGAKAATPKEKLTHVFLFRFESFGLRSKGDSTCETQGKSMKIRVNTAEAKLEELMTQRGFEVTKRGWPDFLCFSASSDSVICVEVKRSSKHKLKFEQERIMTILIDAGIPCYRWDLYNGFTDLYNTPITPKFMR